MLSLRSLPLRTATSVKPSRARLVIRNATSFDVRPYTLRKGDTLESIAKKRSKCVGGGVLVLLHAVMLGPDCLLTDVTVEQILGINPDCKVDSVAEGQTIVLPANKLSSRDKEILSGIGTTYRVYPIRAGETLSEVLSKRGISVEEFQKLNPSVEVDKIHGTFRLRRARVIKDRHARPAAQLVQGKRRLGLTPQFFTYTTLIQSLRRQPDCKAAD